MLAMLTTLIGDLETMNEVYFLNHESEPFIGKQRRYKSIMDDLALDLYPILLQFGIKCRAANAE